jgi:hypothetical protein
MVTAAERTSANAHLIVLLGGDAGLRGGEKRQLRVERND